MESNDHELIRHLFSAVSARLEQAHDLSVDGQDGSIAVEQQGELAGRLDADLIKISALAGALVVLTRGLS